MALKIYKKIIYFILTIFLTINSSLAIGEYYNNTLLRVDYLAPRANVVKLNLYFSDPYTAPLNVINKQQNEYLVILPEVARKDGVINDFSHVYGIVSSKIETIPYSKNGKNGYTKLTIKTKNPMTFTLETKILPISILYQQPTQQIPTKPDTTIVAENVDNSVKDLQQNSTLTPGAGQQENLNEQMNDINKITKTDGNLTVEIVPDKTLKTDEKDVLDENGKPQMNYNTLLYVLILAILLLPPAKKYFKRLLYLNKVRLAKEHEINEDFKIHEEEIKAKYEKKKEELKKEKQKKEQNKKNKGIDIEKNITLPDEPDIVFEDFSFDIPQTKPNESIVTEVKEKITEEIKEEKPAVTPVLNKKQEIKTNDKVYVISDKKVSKGKDLIEKASTKLAESNRNITEIINTKATLNTNPITENQKVTKENLDIISKYKVDENRGFALINYNGNTALVGYIGDELFYLKKFFDNKKGTISARINKKILDKTVYMLRVNGYRALYSIDDYKIELMLEM